MSRDPLLLNELVVLSQQQTAAMKKLLISIESRKVRYTADSPEPTGNNAWCYVYLRTSRKRPLEGSPPPLPTLSTYLGPIINVSRNQTLVMTWANSLSYDRTSTSEGNEPPKPRIQEMPHLDGLMHTHMMPGMNPSIGISTHLHGIRVTNGSDGWPTDPAMFYLSDDFDKTTGKIIKEKNEYGFPHSKAYSYHNQQRAAMLWYHDHAMDNTAQQVYAGLAGLYFIRDASDDAIFNLIGSTDQELPLVIQDRILSPGLDRLNYLAGIPEGNNARPEFLGNRIMVNGRTSPITTVKRKVYRLRLLNGSNARTYALTLADLSGVTQAWFGHLLTVIGNDGGLYSVPKQLSTHDFVLLAPGERLDVLMDLSSAPATLSSLRLLNLAVKEQAEGANPVPIFQTVNTSVMQPSEMTMAQISILKQLGEADVMELTLHAEPPGPVLDQKRLADILKTNASDDDFDWNGKQLLAKGAVVRNRLIVLMNNTADLPTTPTDTNPNPLPSPQTGKPWKDTQIWEMKAASNSTSEALSLPFNVDLSDGPTPAPGSPGPAQPYLVSRFSFFQPSTKPNEVMLDPVITMNRTESNSEQYAYPRLFSGPDVIRTRAGTYERWYVANIGNDPVLGTGTPDMHPFHMHLVNFVVTRRWQLQTAPTGGPSFVDVTGREPLDMDGVARHDTVRVPPNELLELLVYFPAGYAGRYPYHCHLLEHEDMGMMLHFEVRQ